MFSKLITVLATLRLPYRSKNLTLRVGYLAVQRGLLNVDLRFSFELAWWPLRIPFLYASSRLLQTT